MIDNKLKKSSKIVVNPLRNLHFNFLRSSVTILINFVHLLKIYILYVRFSELLYLFVFSRLKTDFYFNNNKKTPGIE